MNRILALLLAAAAGLAGCGHADAPPPAAPPTPVVVATARSQDVALTSEWVATLDGYENANIQPQVSGYVVKQDYAEGAPAKKDQVLFEIDPRPFQAALDQTRAQLAVARGQVAQARAAVQQQQANLGTAKLNVQRDLPEAAAHAIPQSQLQTDQQSQQAGEAAVTAAQATVEAQQAAVQAAQAAVEQAQLNLGFTQVRSLLDGVAGIATVQIGNLVNPQTVLTTVSRIEPMKAFFPISAEDYLRSSSHAPGTVDLLTQSPSLQLVLVDGSVYPHPGRVLFSDRQVDASTGTMRLVGAFPNPGGRLRPGQYGRIRVVTQKLHAAVLVPQSAVAQVQGVYQVAIVGPDNKVAMRTVQVGQTVGPDWIVSQGLQPGERVVTEGVSKVRNGSTVRLLPAGGGR